MPVKDRTDLVPGPTIPDDLDQGPRFGGITELVKDAFVLELRHHFDNTNTRIRSGELPRIEKYQFSLDPSTDPLETAVNLIRNYPDIEENLPIVAVMTTSGQNMKLDISSKQMHMVLKSAELIGGEGPYALIDGDTLSIQTYPGGMRNDPVTSTYVFKSIMFNDITQATLNEVVCAINFQALYAQAWGNLFSGVQCLGLRAGGLRGRQFNNSIEVTGGTAIAKLGFKSGAINSNIGGTNQIWMRNYIAATLTVGIEIVAESDNVRTELSDLVFDFFTYVLADKQFTLYGRSFFDSGVLDESYQIILKDTDIRISGDQETPRAGDQKDKIYTNRIEVPVIAIQYSDRIVVDSAGLPVVPQSTITLIESLDLPPLN